MERCRDHVLLADYNGTTAELCEYLDSCPSRFDHRSSDEDRMRGSDTGDVDLLLETVDLTPVSVAMDGNVEYPDLRPLLIGRTAEHFFGQQDGSCTRAEHGEPVLESAREALSEALDG